MSKICELCPTFFEREKGVKCSCAEIENELNEKRSMYRENKEYMLNCETRIQKIFRKIKNV